MAAWIKQTKNTLVDGDILAKFRYVCGFEGRSANAQIIQLMLKFIAEYEKEYGKIQL